MRRSVVTGGASGIGAAIVERLVSEGDTVAVLDQIGPKSGDAERPDQPHLIVDVTDPSAVATAFDKLDQQWGGVDCVVNCAGVSIRAKLANALVEDFRRVVDVNLTGTFIVSQRAVGSMAGVGQIINIASVSGLVGMPGYAGYNASKAGVIELTRTLALELAPGVRVNAVCPGYILTPMQRTEYTEEMLATSARSIPAGRLGQPEEIAGLVAYLASPEAAFAIGSILVLDGGETAGGLASG